VIDVHTNLLTAAITRLARTPSTAVPPGRSDGALPRNAAHCPDAESRRRPSHDDVTIRVTVAERTSRRRHAAFETITIPVQRRSPGTSPARVSLRRLRGRQIQRVKVDFVVDSPIDLTKLNGATWRRPRRRAGYGAALLHPGVPGRGHPLAPPTISTAATFPPRRAESGPTARPACNPPRRERNPITVPRSRAMSSTPTATRHSC